MNEFRLWKCSKCGYKRNLIKSCPGCTCDVSNCGSRMILEEGEIELMARTNLPLEKKIVLRPRNDFVLLRVTDKGITPGGLALPDTAAQGKVIVVVAVGEKVEGLKEGDRVLAIGAVGEDLVGLPSYLPNSRGLVMTRQQNVILVLEGDLWEN